MWVGFEDTKFWMTRPKVVKDKLILIACYLYTPDTPVLDCLSLPAKSTRLSLPTLVVIFPFTSYWFSIIIVNIEWDLEDVAFIWVSATTLCFFPVLYLFVIYF